MPSTVIHRLDFSWYRLRSTSQMHWNWNRKSHLYFRKNGVVNQDCLPSLAQWPYLRWLVNQHRRSFLRWLDFSRYRWAMPWPKRSHPIHFWRSPPRSFFLSKVRKLVLLSLEQNPRILRRIRIPSGLGCTRWLLPHVVGLKQILLKEHLPSRTE